MYAGINLEFARTEGFSFEEGLRRSSEAGYEFVEPYVYSIVDVPINSHLAVRTTTGYNHIDTGTADARKVSSLMDNLGLRFSAFDVHSSLLLPQIGVPYLVRAIDFAADVDCPIVMSDEGPLPEGWMSLDRAFDIMCISMEAIVKHAQARGVRMAVELHNALTTRPDKLGLLLERFSPDELGVNFDTGNSFLAGNDPVEMLKGVADRVIHVHAKDIPESQLHLRGKVTGARVGVAVGDGVIDMAGIVSALASAGYDGVISVECDTLAEAEKSLARLEELFQAVHGRTGK